MFFTSVKVGTVEGGIFNFLCHYILCTITQKLIIKHLDTL